MRKVTIVLVLLVVAGVVSFIWTDYHRNKHNVIYTAYAGRSYFEASTYSEFKKYLAEHPEVEIEKLTLLLSQVGGQVGTALSSPDTLVDFEVRVPKAGYFPYGGVVEVAKKVNQETAWIATLLSTLGFWLLMLFLRLAGVLESA